MVLLGCGVSWAAGEGEGLVTTHLKRSGSCRAVDSSIKHTVMLSLGLYIGPVLGSMHAKYVGTAHVKVKDLGCSIRCKLDTKTFVLAPKSRA